MVHVFIASLLFLSAAQIQSPSNPSLEIEEEIDPLAEQDSFVLEEEVEIETEE